MRLAVLNMSESGEFFMITLGQRKDEERYCVSPFMVSVKKDARFGDADDPVADNRAWFDGIEKGGEWTLKPGAILDRLTNR